MNFPKTIKAFFFTLFLITSHFAIAQLTIHLNDIPSNTPANDDIFIVGNFNDWNPVDNNFKLTDNNNGTFQITFNPPIGELEFKFTRGDWSNVEGNENGSFRPNRTLQYNGGQQSENLTVLSWEDLGNSSGNTTLTYNTYILSEDFEIPQLNRTRRLLIYLPPNYETTDHTYPVMYMQDGQNLFDQYTSFSGEWEVDESLNTIFDNGDDGIIIVGIDNGGEHRIDEYTPWTHPEYGGGEGDAYVDFIVDNLKPFIDSNFRTKTDRLNTGIMGSSLGGLISFYAAIEHQDVFSKAGIFSPSFWFSDQVYTHVENTGKQHDMKFYLLGGEQESATLIQELETMQTTLLNAGFQASEVLLHTHSDGQHSEWFWNREFPDAYIWLFNDIVNTTQEAFANNISISPNPVRDTLYINTPPFLGNASVHVYNMYGQLVLVQNLTSEGKISMQNLPSKTYVLAILVNGQRVFVEQIVKVGRD